MPEGFVKVEECAGLGGASRVDKNVATAMALRHMFENSIATDFGAQIGRIEIRARATASFNRICSSHEI